MVLIIGTNVKDWCEELGRTFTSAIKTRYTDAFANRIYTDSQLHPDHETDR